MKFLSQILKLSKTVVTVVIIFSSIHNAGAQDGYTNVGSVYFGAGTSVSSYLGGYFGQAYTMRVLSSNSDYYDSYSYNYGYDYYDEYTLWSPIQLDFTAGFFISDNIAIESEASFLFHYNGRVDPEFTSGTIGERDYLDRNDYAQLYAVPVSVTAKLILTGGGGYDAYIKAGPAFQYTNEKYEKIREFYSYSGYNEYSSDVYLGTVEKTRWLNGFRVGIGTQYLLSDYMSGYTELEYSYFNIDGDNSTALALDKAPEAQLFSLKTMIYFTF
jgi:hypothetical protein